MAARAARTRSSSRGESRAEPKEKPRAKAAAEAAGATPTRAGGSGDGDESASAGTAEGSTRSIWSGSISFGLLQIPVGIYSAEARREISFRQLDKRDMSPIGYERINKTTREPVAWGDIVRGFEHEKGEFVVITDEELKSVNVEATQTIDIQDFVDAEAIHPAHYETPYYLAPNKKSQKAYAVLREALKRTKKAAIATVVMRTREHLAAIFAHGDVLLLEILRFAHEIRSTDTLALPPSDLATLKVHPKEIEMAEKLVLGMSSAWEPTKYHDQYRDDVLAMIDEKVRTGEVTALHEPSKRKDEARVVDIMSVLKRSLEEAEKSRSAAGPKKASPRKAGAKGGRAA
jgi:DNA end-binding protein Ku